MEIKITLSNQTITCHMKLKYFELVEPTKMLELELTSPFLFLARDSGK